MKATGEVMSIDKSFEGALMKAARSLEQELIGLSLNSLKEDSLDVLKGKIQNATDERIFAVAEAFRRGADINEIYNWSQIDKFFLDKIQNIVKMENKLAEDTLTPQLLKQAKTMQFPDQIIASLTGKTQENIAELREKNNIFPAYKIVNTCPENPIRLSHTFTHLLKGKSGQSEENLQL